MQMILFIDDILKSFKLFFLPLGHIHLCYYIYMTNVSFDI